MLKRLPRALPLASLLFQAACMDGGFGSIPDTPLPINTAGITDIYPDTCEGNKPCRRLTAGEYAQIRDGHPELSDDEITAIRFVPTRQHDGINAKLSMRLDTKSGHIYIPDPNLRAVSDFSRFIDHMFVVHHEVGHKIDIKNGINVAHEAKKLYKSVKTDKDLDKIYGTVQTFNDNKKPNIEQRASLRAEHALQRHLIKLEKAGINPRYASSDIHFDTVSNLKYTWDRCVRLEQLERILEFKDGPREKSCIGHEPKKLVHTVKDEKDKTIAVIISQP